MTNNMVYHKTISASAYGHYKKSMRSPCSMMTLMKILEYFQPKKILEIGFFQGQTLGLICESVPEESDLTTIDVQIDLSVFDRLFGDIIKQKMLNVQFLEMDSRRYQPDRQFDFINVDGGPELRYDDLMMASTTISPDGIIMFDNYGKFPDQIETFLSQGTGLVPFLIDGQALFLHYPHHDANDFLDNVLPKYFLHFCDVVNVDYHSHLISEIKPIPVSIHIFDRVVLEFCKSMDI